MITAHPIIERMLRASLELFAVLLMVGPNKHLIITHYMFIGAGKRFVCFIATIYLILLGDMSKLLLS